MSSAFRVSTAARPRVAQAGAGAAAALLAPELRELGPARASADRLEDLLVTHGVVAASVREGRAIAIAEAWELRGLAATVAVPDALLDDHEATAAQVAHESARLVGELSSAPEVLARAAEFAQAMGAAMLRETIRDQVFAEVFAHFAGAEGARVPSDRARISMLKH